MACGTNLEIDNSRYIGRNVFVLQEKNGMGEKIAEEPAKPNATVVLTEEEAPADPRAKV